MTLTQNEKKVLRLIASSILDRSINEIAKECKLAPNGAYKILIKLEKEGILKAKQIANLRSFRLDFEHPKTNPLLTLAFMPDKLSERVQIRAEDFKPLKEITQVCILFGSYARAKEQPKDLDILFVLDAKSLELYKKKLALAQDRIPVKIHDVIQTKEDMVKNLKKNDPIIIETIRNGILLWGFEVIVQVIRNANE